MNVNYATKLLDVLIGNSARVLEAGFGVNWAESTFFDVVRLLRQEDFLKDKFLHKVVSTFEERAPETLASQKVPIELIELIAHEFRWPELLELARRRVEKFFGGNEKLAIGDISTRLLVAYRDDWPDREFYAHYSDRAI